jgi:hypothetical protein
MSIKMAKTVAGKISGVLNRKSFFQLWMRIAWNWGDPVKNFLLISKDISFIIKMVWSLFWLFQKKSSKPWPEKTLVWLIWYQIYDFECVLLLEINKEFLTGWYIFRDIWVQSRKFGLNILPNLLFWPSYWL